VTSPAGNWRRPLGRPRITWMKTIQQDLKSSDLNMDDAVDLAQNRPLWRLMSTFGATHSWWCLPEMNEWMNDSDCGAIGIFTLNCIALYRPSIVKMSVCSLWWLQVSFSWTLYPGRRHLNHPTSYSSSVVCVVCITLFVGQTYSVFILGLCKKVNVKVDSIFCFSFLRNRTVLNFWLRLVSSSYSVRCAWELAQSSIEVQTWASISWKAVYYNTGLGLYNSLYLFAEWCSESFSLALR